MKKTIIYLCLITFVSLLMFNSCYDNRGKMLSDEITIEQIQPYDVSQQEIIDEDLLVDYYIIETDVGREIIIDDLVSYLITDVVCLKETKLSNTETRADICNELLYDLIDEQEQLYEKSSDFISFYKKAKDGTIYHKCIFYNSSHLSSNT